MNSYEEKWKNEIENHKSNLHKELIYKTKILFLSYCKKKKRKIEKNERIR